MAVTNNIREIREQRGIYQNDLAAAIGFSTKTVGRIERGDSTPSAEFMLQISKYFNMLVDENDVENIKKIAYLRTLGISIEDIRSIISEKSNIAGNA